jgi:uracil-DNA glycosylase
LVNTTVSPTLTTPVAFPRFESLDAFQTYVRAYKESGLCRTATHAVLGAGCEAQPLLTIICDTPDTQEDTSGQAFTGPGNQLVRAALRHAGFDPGQIYCTYVSKWRPPGQRSLTAIELKQLSSMLYEELRLIQPKAILTLGESALKAVLSENMPVLPKTHNIINIKNHIFNIEIAVLPSQKGEFLVKNPTMKKDFWLSLLRLANSLGQRV